jgi:hypothetical protein
VILELSTTYWSVGIVLKWHPEGARDHDGNKAPGWSGEVEYYDDGWAGDDDADAGKVSTEGVLRTRSVVADGGQRTALAAITDTLIADASRLRIKFRDHEHLPRLYVPGDGKWADTPLPDGWRELLAAEAARIGWKSYPTATPIA